MSAPKRQRAMARLLQCCRATLLFFILTPRMPRAPTRIELAGGRQAQANLTLSPAPFTLSRPSSRSLPAAAIGSSPQFSPIAMGKNGLSLRQNEKGHSLCAYLPDGAYTLAIQGSTDDEPDGRTTLVAPGAQAQRACGSAGLCRGRPMKKPLRVPLSAGVTTPVHLRYDRDLHPRGRQPRTAKRSKCGNPIHWTCGAARAKRIPRPRGGSNYRRGGRFRPVWSWPWPRPARIGSAPAPMAREPAGRGDRRGKNLAYSRGSPGRWERGRLSRRCAHRLRQAHLQLPAGILAEPVREILRCLCI